LNEEVLEPDPKYKRDAQKRRQRRKKMPAFNLRQHRRREAGMGTELRQPKPLVKPQCADLRTNVVARETGGERVGQQGRLTYFRVDQFCDRDFTTVKSIFAS